MYQKRILFILKQAPYGSSAAREAIDMILASAAYDQVLDVLFMGDGIYQLLDNQQPTQQKRISALLCAFEMYEIENLYYEQQALTSRALSPDSLAIEALSQSTAEIQSLIQQADAVLTF